MSQNNKISNTSPHVFEFAEFSFDAADKVLYKDGEIITLAPKACELLGVFIKNAGKLISRDELMNQVWADSFVEEANLTHHISALRKTLGEDNNGRKFIETIPRKGYRFIAPIIEAKKETAEIIITERTTARAIETTEIQTGENLNLVQPADVKLSEITKKPRRKISFVAPFLLIGGLIVAAFFGWRWFASSGDVFVPTPQTITFKRITPDADVFGAAISPDGKTAAYFLMENGGGAIWRKNVETGETSQLTPTRSLTDDGTCGYQRYSPDGKWLYYGCLEERNTKVNAYRISESGGVPQKISQNIPTDYAFSPDGTEAAFTLQPKQVIIIRTDGSGQRVAAERDGVNKYFSLNSFVSSDWSSDGKRLIVPGARVEEGRETSELVEIDLQTKSEKIIASSENFKFQQVHRLADDSGLIVTTRDLLSNSRRIQHVSYPDGKITPLTDESKKFSFVRLSKDSRKIIALQDIGNFNLWTASANDLSQRKQITAGGSAQNGTNGLDFKADGKIIYTSPQSGNIDLWTANADGGEQKQLTVNSGKSNYAPQVTPDGKYIVFVSNRSGTEQIWRIDAADGRNPIQLSRGEKASKNRISSDGKTVYYLGGEKGRRAYRVSIDGGEPVLFDNRTYFITPDFSLDGKWFFYTETDPGGAPVYSSGLTNAATSETAELPESRIFGEWSPDSKSFVFIKAEKQLWKFDIAQNSEQKIADFSPNIIANFAISPDGNNYVFALGNFNSEVVLIENFLGGETK